MKKITFLAIIVTFVGIAAFSIFSPAIASISTACIILMAVVQNPLIGRTRQQAGGMVFSKMYDKNVMRAKPFSYNDRNSTEQQTQRNFFKSITSMVSQLKSQARSFFYTQPADKSAYSAILQTLLTESSVNAGVRTINSATTYFGNGKYSINPFVDAAATEDTTHDCIINWTTPLDIPSELGNSTVVAVFLNTTQNKVFYFETSVLVKDDTFSVNFPDDWESQDDFICYLSAINLSDNTSMAKFKAGADLANKVK